MSSLLKQINEQVDRQQTELMEFTTNVECNCNSLSADMVMVCETANEFIAQLVIDLQKPAEVADLDRKVATITGLEMLASSDNREAFGVNSKSKFLSIMDLLKRDGDDSLVKSKVKDADGDNFDLAYIGKQASTAYAKNLERIKGFSKMEQEQKTQVLNYLTKMRLQYERALAKLRTDVSAKQDSTTGTAPQPA